MTTTLVLICLLLVIAGLVTYFFKPTPGFAIVCAGLIMYLLIILIKTHG